jgi:hypothetical protein
MVDTPQTQEEKRLIILLPAELLEELRQAAEEADLSVSQVVRRAIRNELRSIGIEKQWLEAGKPGDVSLWMRHLEWLLRTKEEFERTTSGVDLTKELHPELKARMAKNEKELKLPRRA